MPVLDYLEIKGKKIAIDEEGYLVNFDDWDEAVAATLAGREGLADLTDDKLAALRFIREYYKKYNYFPILNAICKNIHKPKDCVQEDFINALLAWKLAGLPKPEEPIISLLEAGQSPG
jgi:TusE/DsrC/DsvC family sulfur relay protein